MIQLLFFFFILFLTQTQGTEIQYEFDPLTKTLQITANGEITQFDWNNENYLLSDITSIKFNEGITYIKSYLFNNLPNLFSIILPSSLKQIEENAFTNCPKLTQIYYQNNVFSTVSEISNYLNKIKMVKSTENNETNKESNSIECPENCKNCSIKETHLLCTECIEEYVNTQTHTCVHWKAINKCTEYDSENQKCAECDFTYKLNEHGDECIFNALFSLMYLGISIVVTVIVVIAIIIVVKIIHKKCVRTKDKEPDPNKHESIIDELIELGHQFIPIGDTVTGCVNTKKIDFGKNIEMGKESSMTIFIGNTAFKSMKVEAVKVVETKQRTVHPNRFNTVLNPSVMSVANQNVNENITGKVDVKIEPKTFDVSKGCARDITVTITPKVLGNFTGKLLINLSNKRKFDVEEVEIPLSYTAIKVVTTNHDNNPNTLQKIGEGRHTIVYKQIMNNRELVVKKLKGINGNLDQIETKHSYKNQNFDYANQTNNNINGTNQLVKYFEEEVKVLKKARNEYLLGYHGTNETSSELSILVEYCPLGTLRDLMKVNPRRSSISDKYRLKILLDVSTGLSYLHSHKIAHRNVKPENIYILSLEETQITAKIGDFGKPSKMYEFTSMDMIDGKINPTYMAPETLNSKINEIPSDCFSFGVVIMETFLWHNIYEKICQKEWDIFNYVIKGKRVNQTREIPVKIYEIVDNLWKEEMELRMKMKEVKNKLDEIYYYDYNTIDQFTLSVRNEDHVELEIENIENSESEYEWVSDSESVTVSSSSSSNELHEKPMKRESSSTTSSLGKSSSSSTSEKRVNYESSSSEVVSPGLSEYEYEE